MILKINLLPEGLKKIRAETKTFDLSGLKLPNVPRGRLIIALIAAVFALHGIIFGIGVYGKAHLASLEKRYGYLSRGRDEAEDLRRQSGTIQRKITAINELTVKRFSWARKLNDLSDSLTPGIWLSEISYDEKTADSRLMTVSAPRQRKASEKTASEGAAARYLVIYGYAASMGEQGTALVARFIKALKDNPSFYGDFSDIELGMIKSGKVEGQEVMSFKITCRFKGPR